MASQTPPRDAFVPLLGLIALALFLMNFSIFLTRYLSPKLHRTTCFLPSERPPARLLPSPDPVEIRIRYFDHELRPRAESLERATELEFLSRRDASQREAAARRAARVQEVLGRARAVLDQPLEVEVNVH